jgi:hypothetical protein
MSFLSNFNDPSRKHCDDDRDRGMNEFPWVPVHDGSRYHVGICLSEGSSLTRERQDMQQDRRG